MYRLTRRRQAWHHSVKLRRVGIKIIKMSHLSDSSSFIKRHSRKIGKASVLSLRVNNWSSRSHAWKIYNSTLRKSVFTKISLSLNPYINLHKLLRIYSRTYNGGTHNTRTRFTFIRIFLKNMTEFRLSGFDSIWLFFNDRNIKFSAKWQQGFKKLKKKNIIAWFWIT